MESAGSAVQLAMKELVLAQLQRPRYGHVQHRHAAPCAAHARHRA